MQKKQSRKRDEAAGRALQGRPGRRDGEAASGKPAGRADSSRQELALSVVRLVGAVASVASSGRYSGSEQELEAVLDLYRDACPAEVVLLLVRLCSKSALPWKTGWVDRAQLLASRYYVKEQRAAVRIETLRQLSGLWDAWKALHAIEAADAILLPVLAHVPFDRSASTRAEGLCLLAKVASHCATMPGTAASETLDVVVYLALMEHGEERRPSRQSSRQADRWAQGSRYSRRVPKLLSSSEVGRLVCGAHSAQASSDQLSALVETAVSSLRSACGGPSSEDHCGLVASMCLGWIAGRATQVVPATLACRLMSAMAAVLGQQTHGHARVLALRGLRRLSADEDGYLTMISPSTGTMVVSAVRTRQLASVESSAGETSAASARGHKRKTQSFESQDDDAPLVAAGSSKQSAPGDIGGDS